MKGLQPVNRGIRLWGWFYQLPSESQRQLGNILHLRKSHGFTDFTRADWFTAMGYVVSQLLRHGKRGGFDRGPHEPVRGAIPLNYVGPEKWMKVSDIVQQPNCVMMQVSANDVVEFALRQMRATDIRSKDKRLTVEKIHG